MGLYPDRRQKLSAAFAALLMLGFPGAAAAEPLAICLDDGAPPYSFNRKSGTGGFDLALGQALAERLGREFKAQWFESEYEREERLALDANALLSAGRCDLVAAYPLVSAMLGLPAVANAPLPRHEGGKGGPRGERVRLGTLVASKPYHAAPLELFLGAGVGRKVASLADLGGLRLGARSGTLAGELLARYGGGRYMADIVTLPVLEDVLPALDAGSIDAALVERHHYDAWKAKHADSGIVPTGYRHPIVFNFGYAALEPEAALLAEVNEALAAMQADGTIERLAGEAGMSYFAPARPEVFDRLTPGMLAGG